MPIAPGSRTGRRCQLNQQVIDPVIDGANVGSVLGEYLNRRHYTRLVQTDAMYFSATTGRLVLMLLKQCLPKDIWQQAYEHLRTVHKAPTNRGMAVAGKGAMMPRITSDEMLSERRAIPKAVMEAAGNPKSDFIGFFDYAENLGCRETEWTGSHPEVLLGTEPFIREVNAIFRAALPYEYATQWAEVRKVPAEFRIADTAFTTVTVNKNLRTTCHRDEGDLREGMGCMATLGSWDGYEFIIPEYGLAVDYQPGDLLLGDVHLAHGNGPKGDGERITTVLYCRERMHECR